MSVAGKQISEHEAALTLQRSTVLDSRFAILNSRFAIREPQSQMNP